MVNEENKQEQERNMKDYVQKLIEQNRQIEYSLDDVLGNNIYNFKVQKGKVKPSTDLVQKYINPGWFVQQSPEAKLKVSDDSEFKSDLVFLNN